MEKAWAIQLFVRVAVSMIIPHAMSVMIVRVSAVHGSNLGLKGMLPTQPRETREVTVAGDEGAAMFDR